MSDQPYEPRCFDCGDACATCGQKIERLRAALERIEVRGLEIISEHVGGSDASYVAQELTAIAREAIRDE